MRGTRAQQVVTFVMFIKSDRCTAVTGEGITGIVILAVIGLCFVILTIHSVSEIMHACRLQYRYTVLYRMWAGFNLSVK